MDDRAAILLVDDDHDFCESVASYFEERSCTVLTATDPRLLKSMDIKNMRVILLDIDMPRLSGLDVLESIRLQNDRVMTIMISGHSDLNTRLSCLDKGADFFLAKPVDFSELFMVVRRILGQDKFESRESAGAQWLLSRSRHKLISPTGDAIGLSASEFRVFELLCANSPELVSREELTEAATGRMDVSKIYSRALEVLISRVRSRASSNEVKLPVKALRNAGYVFHGNGTVID